MNTVFAFSALQFMQVCYTPYDRIPYGHLYQAFTERGHTYMFFGNTSEASRHAELKGWRFIRRPDPELSPPRLADQRAGETDSSTDERISEWEAQRRDARAGKVRRAQSVENEVAEQNLMEDAEAES